jgi:subtilisin family serine protease
LGEFFDFMVKKVFPSLASFLCCFLLLSGIHAFPQQRSIPVSTVDSLDKRSLNWYNLDPSQDKVQGASVDRAYSALPNDRLPGKKIVVAYLGIGIDINHPDLKGKIWTNNGEIPGNGTDDDKNGFTDDIHGWNFLGNGKGENIEYENFEETRIYRKLKPLYQNITSVDSVPAGKQDEYKLYLKCADFYEKEQSKYQILRFNTEIFEKKLNEAESVLEIHFDKPKFTKRDVYRISSTRTDVLSARDFMIGIYDQGFNERTLPDLKEKIKNFLNRYLNTEFDPRKITGDDPEDIHDTIYGNGDIRGPVSEDGTMIAGVVAAYRGNSTGIDGVAANAEIMALRVGLKGDERDKDVALAIRYAVNNGAKIILLDIAKNLSPHKDWVDEALKYAMNNNVLIVRKAGNEGRNLDKNDLFPNGRFPDGSIAENWITTGATGMKADKDLCSVSTNWGKQSVDLFAPGEQIISLCADNKYGRSEGTGVAAAVVAGAASFVWSYYPELTVSELKNILTGSVTQFPSLKVIIPGQTAKEKQRIGFSDMSKAGGIVNVFEAMKQADKICRIKTR